MAFNMKRHLRRQELRRQYIIEGMVTDMNNVLTEYFKTNNTLTAEQFSNMFKRLAPEVTIETARKLGWNITE